MVSNASDDFPEPDGPVTTVRVRRGISRSNPFRLCWRAPRTTIASFIATKTNDLPWRRGGQRGGGDPAGKGEGHGSQPAMRRAPWPPLSAPDSPACDRRDGGLRSLRRRRTPRPPLRGHAVDPEEQHRSDDRQHHAPDAEAGQTGARNDAAQEAADERTDDSDQHRHQNAARILPRHDRFCDRSGDETQHDPGNHTHGSTPRPKWTRGLYPVATVVPLAGAVFIGGYVSLPLTSPLVHTAVATSAVQEDDVLGKAYDARLMRRLLRYLRPHRWAATGAILLLCIQGSLQVVGPYLTQQVIDVALPARDADAVVRLAMLFVGVAVVQFGLGYWDVLLTTRLGQGVMHDLRMEIFGKLQRLPVAYFDRNPVGRLITRVTSDVEALNELFTAGVIAGFGDLFT